MQTLRPYLARFAPPRSLLRSATFELRPNLRANPSIRQYANRQPPPDPNTRGQTRWERIDAGPQHQQYNRSSGPQYTRFGRARTTFNLFQRWRARPTFKYEAAGLGGAGGAFYVYNLETVPVTQRRRFNVVTEQQEEGFADQMYQQVMQEYGERVLPGYDVRVQKVERVLKRLLPSAEGMGMREKAWKVHVVEDEQKNAFVIPGFVEYPSSRTLWEFVID